MGRYVEDIEGAYQAADESYQAGDLYTAEELVERQTYDAMLVIEHYLIDIHDDVLGTRNKLLAVGGWV